MKVINMYAGPSSGKSTTAAGLFFLMKTHGYKVELVTEFAKDRVYEGHLGCLEDQIYIFGQQQRRPNRLRGQVDYAITDSPLPLSIAYMQHRNSTLEQLVLETFSTYENYNFFITRVKKYRAYGRTQTEDQAIQLDEIIKGILNSNRIKYTNICGDAGAPKEIYHELFGDWV